MDRSTAGHAAQRFPLITDNKRLLRADGARDLSDYHYVDFKRTAGLLKFPCRFGRLGGGLSMGVCVCMLVWQSVWMCIDVAQNLQTL